MGPPVAERRPEAMERFVGDACERGAGPATGGERIGNMDYFFAPTVLTDVPEDAPIMNEEPFGPVAPIRPFKDFDEVIERANKLRFGLASYAFSRDHARATMAADRIEAGNVAINSLVPSTPETPFGGINDSGYGSEGGPEGIEAYLRTKTVTETGL